ncbi:MAG TPA: META domain-containing protein [Pseudobdellovibrionaceae bacterium]
MKLVKVILLIGVVCTLGNLQKLSASETFDSSLAEEAQLTVSFRQKLERVTWKLISISDQSSRKNLSHYNQTLLFFGKGVWTQKFSGRAACNNFSGEFDDHESAISNVRVRSTRMLCEAYEVEVAYLEALRHALSYRVKGERLLIQSQNGILLTFARL